MLIVRSPVRISFGGGGTDLPAYYQQFGGSVLSVAINKYFYTILTSRADRRIQVISSDLRVFETWHEIANTDLRGTSLEIPLAVLKEMNCDIAVDLFLASEIPPGTGLGSSASVCVNILKTLSTYLEQPISKYELAERSFHIARDILRKHVGKQDEYAAAFGGLNFISFDPDGGTTVEPIELSPPVLAELQRNLMLFFVGSAHHSWSILQEQESSTREKSDSTIQALHEVKALAARMRKAVQQSDLRELGILLDEAWQAKRRISKRISTPRIDELYALAREHGALGGKITGAGGGGFLLIYCEPRFQSAVRDAMRCQSVYEMTFSFDMQGATAIANDPFMNRDESNGCSWTFLPKGPIARIA
ncbi:MAG TPA: hypothetical protein VKV39_14795 [Candidatus Sulfotelmatobacter sp.]|nr:hypothetical protein [Candidatus Sulfotelmatobacter sp.]